MNKQQKEMIRSFIGEAYADSKGREFIGGMFRSGDAVVIRKGTGYTEVVGQYSADNFAAIGALELSASRSVKQFQLVAR